VVRENKGGLDNKGRTRLEEGRCDSYHYLNNVSSLKKLIGSFSWGRKQWLRGGGTRFTFF
jgi:hypothetical protein